jgi:hypothetical protein
VGTLFGFMKKVTWSLLFIGISGLSIKGLGKITGARIMTQRKQTILDTITLLQNAKHLLEKELEGWSVTDEITNIIKAL